MRRTIRRAVAAAAPRNASEVARDDPRRRRDALCRTRRSAPPQTVFGQVNAPQFTDEEKLCYALSYSVKCYAILDTFITLINILFSYYWWVMLFLLTGPLCGWIGADHFKPGYIQHASRAEPPLMNRGAAAAATQIFR